MTLPETIVLDVPNLLTAGGVMVGLLSAAYAWRSARQAQRQADAAERSVHEASKQSALARASLEEIRSQTKLAAHAHRLDIYRAFLTFQSSVNGSGPSFRREATWALWEHAQVAEFYYPAEIANTLTGLVDLSIDIQRSREAWSDEASPAASERQALVRKTYEQYEQLRQTMFKLNTEMRSQLKVTQG